MQTGYPGPQVTILLGGVLCPKTGCVGEDKVVVEALRVQDVVECMSSRVLFTCKELVYYSFSRLVF